MSFTNLSTVKKHLLSSTFGPLHVEDFEIQLHGTADVELPHHNLASDFELVKRCENNVPLADSSVVLKFYDWIPLSNDNIVPRSVVIALAETLSTVYLEETDYQVDYALGKVRRIEGTSIPHATSVVVYYLRYREFAAGTDYVLDYSGGKIHRTSGGAIPDGGRVLIDYDVTAGSVQDDLITQAITEAEDVIVRNLAPGYDGSSTDQGLKTGATWLALSIVCRSLAAESLSRVAWSDAGSRGKEFQQLSEQYQKKAWQLLQPFINPIALRSPVRFANE